MEPVTWLGVVGVVFAAAVAGGTFLVAYLNNGTRLMKRVDELTTRVFALQDDASACRQRENDLKADVTAATTRIKALETATGAAPPAPLAGIVVTDGTGTILEYSPALTPILGYRPRDVRGKSLELLIPPEELERHRPAFARGVANPDAIDPTREVLTYALDEGGARVPVGITMHGRRVGAEVLITASIRQRARGAGEPPPPPAAQQQEGK